MYVKRIIHKRSVTIFDDYYLKNNQLTKLYGCNKIINDLGNNFKFKKLPFTDKFFEKKKYKFIKMIKVSSVKT
jgi:hypothetical protein